MNEEGGTRAKERRRWITRNTNKSEKIKDALVKTKTFALNLPFISHLRVFLDRKSKWEKLYDEEESKSLQTTKARRVDTQLHRFGRVEEIIDRFESRKYASGPRSVAAYMAALIASQRMDKYFEQLEHLLRQGRRRRTT